VGDSSNSQDELRKIRDAMRAQEALRGILPDEQIDATLAALREQEQVYLARLQGPGAVVREPGAGGDQIDARQAQGTLIHPFGPVTQLFAGNVYLGPKPENPAQALAIYRRLVAQATASLPLRGVDVGASDPTTAGARLGLVNVYVDLDTTSRVKAKEGKKASRQPRQAMPGEEETRPLPALEAAIANRRLVLLGDPGGGKSTFVNFLAHCLAAHALQPEAGWLNHLPGWPEGEKEILPVVVVLRDFARSLPEKLPAQAEPRHLWDFIAARLTAQNLDDADPPLHQALEGGQALVLLDGLDEVPTQAQRAFVRDAVQAFAGRYPANRYLATCRALSYQPPQTPQEPDLRLAGFPSYELAAFDEEKIERFIQAWYQELARLGTVAGEDAPGLTRRLGEAVRRPDLWRLAANPLLLTVMALVHTHKGRLPEARALLYEETVDILLWRWEQLKLAGQEEAPRLRQLLLEAGRTDVDLKRVLWELAYTAHSQTGEEQGSESLADIGQYQLQKALAGLKDGDHTWARAVAEAMKLRAGLLLERAPEAFTFPHRTFQEYLAGAHLAAQANFAARAAQLARQGGLWREVVLLAAGKLVYLSGDLDKPLALVGELCPAEMVDNETAWQQAWLAGEALLEIGLNRAQDSALGRDLGRRVQKRLADLLAQGKLAPRERARAGDTLAQLGDPRFDSALWYLPDEPQLGFVEIPAGPFRMGSDPKKDKDADRVEQPQHEANLPTFYLARYPVTTAQFQAFVEDNGYQPRDPDSLRGLPNGPVVRVTWYDALAYCRWLNGKLLGYAQKLISEEKGRGERGSGEESGAAFWQGLASGKLEVTLPSEAEWEKAARGTEGWIYPWEGGFDADKANTHETGIGRTTAVGCFPGGASPYGVLDLSGNVWEWTRSLWGDYPNPVGDEERAKRENLKASSDTPRVLRGGSFLIIRRYARCAYRVGGSPDLGFDFSGFRVVVSPSGGA